MSVDRSELLLPAPAGARVVAAKFLADAASAAPLAVSGDPDALHDFRVAVRRLRSWIRAFDDVLDGAIKGKHRRRLKRIADATNPGRDLHVQLEWLGRTAQHAVSAARMVRPGSAIPARRVRSRDGGSARCDRRTSRRPRRAADGCPPSTRATDRPRRHAAAAIGERIEPFALAERSSRACGGGDERAHTGRIRAKRLRYLLEPASDDVGAAKRSCRASRRCRISSAAFTTRT